MATGIEWTNETWNPIAGCNDVSEGCRHCYARGMARRLEAMGQPKYAGLTVLQGSHVVWTGKIAFDEGALLAPLQRKKPTMYFVNSMSDLFHPGVTDAMIDRIFAVMALCPQHTFQVLTKRPERMLAYLEQVSDERDMQRWIQHMDELAAAVKWTDWPEPEWPLPNVWLGVSVEEPKWKSRIDLLRETPAAVRFLSLEPLLADLGVIDLSGIDWVIVGGESGAGPGIRPMHPDWMRSLRDQCVAAGVPFFFKQWGEWAEVPRQWLTETLSPQMVQRGDLFLTPAGEFDVLGADLRSNHESTGSPMRRAGKKAAGRLLDGREWSQFPAGPR